MESPGVNPCEPVPGRGRYDRTVSASQRAQLARMAICTALRGVLCEANDLSRVAVADVIQRSGVGRNTFYGHFPDLTSAANEVLKQCLDEVQQRLAVREETGAPLAAVHEFTLRWFDAAATVSEAMIVCFQHQPEALREFLEAELRALHRLGADAGTFRRSLEIERVFALSAAVLELSRAVLRGAANRERCQELASEVITQLCR